MADLTTPHEAMAAARLRAAYADPPYPGQAAKHYADHPDYAGEVDLPDLLWRLHRLYDGWLLHTSSVALPEVLLAARQVGVDGFRIMAWVKPFAAFTEVTRIEWRYR